MKIIEVCTSIEMYINLGSEGGNVPLSFLLTPSKDCDILFIRRKSDAPRKNTPVEESQD